MVALVDATVVEAPGEPETDVPATVVVSVELDDAVELLAIVVPPEGVVFSLPLLLHSPLEHVWETIKSEN